MKSPPASSLLQRATSPEVKEFAQKMVDAHTGTTAKLKGIIASNNIKVTPPAHVDNRRQGMLDDLRGAKAEDFDHRYIVQQVAAHKEADTLFSGYAKAATMPPSRILPAPPTRTSRCTCPWRRSWMPQPKAPRSKDAHEIGGGAAEAAPFCHHRRPS